MYRTSALISFLLALFCCANGLKILGIFPCPTKSHYILGNSLMRGLAGMGHEVSFISAYADKSVPKEWKWRDIVLDGLFGGKVERNISIQGMNQIDLISNLLDLNHYGNELTEGVFAHPKVQKLLRSNEKFDVVIIEQFIDDALKVLGFHFKVPVVLLSTIGANAWVTPLVGNPAPPSYVPEMLLKCSPKMTLPQRILNGIIYIVGELNRHLLFFPAQNRILKKYFPDGPDLSELLYNNSLILLNSHPATNQPVPLVPNMIEIGGYHVFPPAALPKDLQEFLDGADEGVVYFSMGSHLKSANWRPEKTAVFLRVFSKLKQKVLWKWEVDALPGKPANVKTSKWLPQQSVLAHKNVKAFITHGGLLSTIETIYHGVPILAIPIYGDQKLNAAVAENNGYGLTLSYDEITEEKLGAKLKEILNNPTYAETAKRRSRILHDRPMKPMDTAIYWIEYVVRHGGATHLRSEALNLRWYQHLYLDALAIFAIAFYILKKLCCFVSTSLRLGKNQMTTEINTRTSTKSKKTQ